LAAQELGWRGPFWRHYRKHERALASIQNEPEFKSIFDDIQRDMARQRACLAARPKGCAARTDRGVEMTATLGDVLSQAALGQAASHSQFGRSAS
jgi:hypothetical protein